MLVGLILRWNLFRAIDYQHFKIGFARLQVEPTFFLQGRYGNASQIQRRIVRLARRCRVSCQLEVNGRLIQSHPAPEGVTRSKGYRPDARSAVDDLQTSAHCLSCCPRPRWALGCMQFVWALALHQSVTGKFLHLPMELHFEPVGQQRLKHKSELAF
jgi:hypothetical protein